MSLAYNTELLQKQPILNIGCLGSVSDGKSTTVYQLTGVKTQRHSNEKTRNITIKPGYANMKIWRNDRGEYMTTNSDQVELDGYNLVHHISFVDCPGHQELILTMMSSVSLMKGAIVVVSAAEPIAKKPQLIQHLAAAKIAGLTKLIILFNKLDLVSKDKALERKEELDELLLKLDIKPQYIIPTCLNKKLGLNHLINSIMELFPPNETDTEIAPEFRITRSFDINRPGTDWKDIKGGVFGGSLLTGQFKIDDEIEIRPGQVGKRKDGTYQVMPFKTRILSIQTEKNSLDTLNPGGLVAIRTTLDPFYFRDDKLAGAVVGKVGSKLHSVYTTVAIKMNFTNAFTDSTEIDYKLDDKPIYLQIGNINTIAKFTMISDDYHIFELSKPVCISDDSLLLVCSNEDKSEVLKITGYGKFNSEKSNRIL
jgi:translation initiation factor 2 subunit 3